MHIIGLGGIHDNQCLYERILFFLLILHYASSASIAFDCVQLFAEDINIHLLN
uniref:Uncharacterized protein n=1 Tax=Rhizophora mucronata TaxID=61149 RepID=A0A2P2J276_RHIMU